MSVVPGFFSWLKLTQELPTAYGVYNAAGAILWVRLYQDTAFDPKVTPVRTAIRSADGYNRRRQNISSRHTVAATLKTPLYPSQAGYWFGAAAALSTPVPPPPDIASYTADYFNGQVIRRYLGGKLNSLAHASSADSQYATLDMSWTFQSTDDANPATFAQPLDSVFPAESPYLHTEAAGRFTVGSTPVVIPMFDSIGLSVGNTLSGKFYDAATISFLKWCGRDVNLSTHLAYQDTSWRTLFEAQTPSAFALEYYRNATQNLTLNFETVSFVADRSLTTPLGDVSEQGVSIEAFYDPAAALSDFSYTALFS